MGGHVLFGMQDPEGAEGGVFVRPDILPRLVNGPTGDPVLYAEFKYERRALLFDLGDVHGLSARSLLKVTHIFVSHTHVDHFIGFDHILRLHLGREKDLALYGPPGLIGNVAGKLAGYSWNLVEKYPYDLRIRVYEVGSYAAQAALFACKSGFRRQEIAPVDDPSSVQVIVDEPSFRVRSVLLEHDIPCLCFSLEEKGHINVDKVKLEGLGLRVGPWIQRLKDAVRNGRGDETLIEAPADEGQRERTRAVPLGVLKNEVLRITRGQKIVYVTDAAFTPENREKIIELARGADIMYCEAAFSQRDEKRALTRKHLTAYHAGYLARSALVDRLVIFHFSPQYHGTQEILYEEASRAFGKSVQ